MTYQKRQGAAVAGSSLLSQLESSNGFETAFRCGGLVALVDIRAERRPAHLCPSQP